MRCGHRRLAVGEDLVPEPPIRRVGDADHAAREQEVGGPSDADEAGEDPAEAVLGGQPELRCGGGELGRRRGESEVAEQREGQRHTGHRTVDGSDDRCAEPHHPCEVVVVLGAHALAGSRRFRGQSGVVVAAIGVPCEGVAVAADRERRGSAGDHDDAYLFVALELVHDVAELGVHPTRPRVVAVGAMEPHRRDVTVRVVSNRLQLHRVVQPPPQPSRRNASPHKACRAGSASSGRQINKSGNQGSRWL